MLVSIVVIGRNEGARLERCLRAVQAMEHEGFATELLYVDSGSSDGSVAVAQRLGAHTITLSSARPTAALGRNAGWRAAQGEIVLFLDGDTVLHPGFVRGSLPCFAEPDCAIVWGHRRELYPRASLYNRVLDLDWIYAPGLTEFCGGDALFHREMLKRTGGFDELLIAGEEPELCRRILALGGKIVHVDAAMTGHDLAMTRFAQYWKRATRAGHAFAEVSARFAGTDSPFWLEDARRNRNRALALLGLPVLGLAASLALGRGWAGLTAAALLRGWMILGLVVLGLIVRTAWKARWKTSDGIALALYGAHSHFQQIPIYLGQLQFRRSQRTGKRTALVEYKGL